MPCNVCGSPGSQCHENTGRCSFFYAYLDKNYQESMVVPCFVRKQLNRMVGKLFLAKDLDEHEFVFKLNKGMYTTHIYGPGYHEFKTKYELSPGDRVRVELDHPPPFFLVKEETYEASTEQSQDDSEDGTEDEREDDIEDQFLEYDGIVPLFTKVLKLTVAQKEIMENRIGLRGFGMVFLVHNFNESDMSNVGLHIPKKVVSVSKIKRRGWAILWVGDSDVNHEVVYFTSTDSRIRFKAGWVDSVEKFNLEAGLVVLVMFDMDNDVFVNISFDVL